MTERTITARVVLNVTVVARDTNLPDEELVSVALESMWLDDSISLNEDDPDDFDTKGSVFVPDPHIAEIEVTS